MSSKYNQVGWYNEPFVEALVRVSWPDGVTINKTFTSGKVHIKC